MYYSNCFCKLKRNEVLKMNSTVRNTIGQKGFYFIGDKEKKECLSLRKIPGVSGLLRVGWIEE